MINSHYISRCLTKYWEFGQRKLLYFDFKSDRIGQASSDTLFAKKGLFSPDLESFLCHRVETFFGKFRKEILNGNDAFDISDWRQYRALFLLVILQAQRFSAVQNEESRIHLEDLPKKGEQFIDGLITTYLEHNQLIGISIQNAGRLFFPEVGFFPFATIDDECVTNFTWGFGVPIHPQYLIAVVSKSADIRYGGGG